MCLAVPAQVIKLEAQTTAMVELDGIKRMISVALVPEAKVGDYVIVHVGHALAKVDTEEAESMLKELEHWREVSE